MLPRSIAPRFLSELAACSQFHKTLFSLNPTSLIHFFIDMIQVLRIYYYARMYTSTNHFSLNSFLTNCIDSGVEGNRNATVVNFNLFKVGSLDSRVDVLLLASKTYIIYYI